LIAFHFALAKPAIQAVTTEVITHTAFDGSSSTLLASRPSFVDYNGHRRQPAFCKPLRDWIEAMSNLAHPSPLRPFRRFSFTQANTSGVK
jgi:hypothetical protein